MINTGRVTRALVALLVTIAFIRPGVTHAATGGIPFEAGYQAQSTLTFCGVNLFCITDVGTGRATGLGPSTMNASDTEGFGDLTSACPFTEDGTATLDDGHGDTLRLHFTGYGCGFGSDSGGLILKPGAFTIVGGTGIFAQATGSGLMYKIGLFSTPDAVWQFRGTIFGVPGLGKDVPAPVPPLGGVSCMISPVSVQCAVPTTNTVSSYTAAMCGTTPIAAQYVITDLYSLTFDGSALTVRWIDRAQASGTFANPVTGHVVPFRFADAVFYHFLSPGNFATALVTHVGSGITFSGSGIPAIPPAQVTFDQNGRLSLGASATLTQLCAALS